MFFLRPAELTKIVLPKVLQNFQKKPKCTCWPKELNQKGFARNIQYRTRPKGPFFRHCATCFKKLFSPRKAPLQFFWSFATKWMLKNPKGSSLSVFFRHCETFFNFFHKSSPNSAMIGNFEVLLLFLSLGFGADLDRSRLVYSTKNNYMKSVFTIIVYRQKRPFYTVICAPMQNVLLIFELISPPLIKRN